MMIKNVCTLLSAEEGDVKPISAVRLTITFIYPQSLHNKTSARIIILIINIDFIFADQNTSAYRKETEC